MVERCVVVDVRVSGACIGVVTRGEANRLLPDDAGSTVHLLDSRELWGEQEPRTVELRAFLSRGSGPLDDEDASRVAITSFLRGVRSFAERRLGTETGWWGIGVVLPEQCSLDARCLVDACARDVGFTVVRRMGHLSAALHAYRLDTKRRKFDALAVDVSATQVLVSLFHIDYGFVELLHASTSRRGPSDLIAGVKNAIDELSEQGQVVLQRTEHLLFTGDITSEESNAVAAELILELVPAAKLLDTFDPRDAATVGMMNLIADGISEHLFKRYSTLPQTASTHICVHSAEPNGTTDLKFCEGERVFFRDNQALGVVRVSGLSSGWNELSVRVSVACELAITIDVIEGESTVRGTLTVTSAATSLTLESTIAYFDELEKVPTLADELTQRERLEAWQCTNALIDAVCDALGRDNPFIDTGNVNVCRFAVAGQRGVSAISTDLLALLDRRGELDDGEQERLHTLAFAFLGDDLQRLGRFRYERCRHCVVVGSTDRESCK